MGFLNPRALRWKIAALTAAACCAVATVIALLVHQSTQEHGQRAGRDRAVAQLHAAEQEYARTGERPAAADLMTQDEVPAPLARDLAGLNRNGEYALWYDEKPPNWHWMWAAVPVGDKVLAIRTDMSAEVRTLQLLDRSIVKAVLTALAAVVPLAALATEPTNRRLRHGARTARRIPDGNLDTRIRHPGRTRDEITEMSTAMDIMATTLQQKLESERRFTADVAHELRTPLMGLVTAASLLPDHNETADLVRTEVGTLRSLTQDLLEISRLDAGVEHTRLDEVPLDDLVTDVARRLGGIDEVNTQNADIVRTDPRRVERILTNLITNTQQHGAAPIQITATRTRIALRDHGPGFPADLLDHGPQRFRTEAAERGRGHGLGLTIALGQAAVLGARLTFDNAADGGAIATLELGHSPIGESTDEPTGQLIG